VEGAARKSELRRAEDQVDAVVCAYVALFAERCPERTTTYGDLQSGYIVTPTLPAGHEPAARGQSLVRSAVDAYAALQPELRTATDGFVRLVTTLLDDAGINYLSVTGRAKSVASFAAKAQRTDGGRPVYPDPLTDITDQIGLRVITYLHSDVAAVADLLADQLRILDDRDMGEETAREGRFGYASRHLLVTLVPGRGPAVEESLAGRRAQVQVRTVLQHAWAEFEHAIRYKGTIPAEHVPDLDRRFTLAAGLLELADREFSAIRDRLQETVEQRPQPDTADPRIGAEDLASFLAAQYPRAGWSRPDHYGWVSGLLLELGITSLDELAAVIASVDTEAVNTRLGYRYPPGAVRRLDDALLVVFGERYLDLHGNAHRVPLLRARLDKLRAVADAGDTD
jgi:ppGpp synthetase/RelA/SpoT-type nucleotidyltranferase